MSDYICQLTKIRQDGMQCWERLDLSSSDRMRYIWLQPFQSIFGVSIGDNAKLEFYRGSGGVIGGHYAAWKVICLVKNDDKRS